MLYPEKYFSIDILINHLDICLQKHPDKSFGYLALLTSKKHRDFSLLKKSAFRSVLIRNLNIYVFYSNHGMVWILETYDLEKYVIFYFVIKCENC